jgi:hypothetical protein
MNEAMVAMVLIVVWMVLMVTDGWMDGRCRTQSNRVRSISICLQVVFSNFSRWRNTPSTRLIQFISKSSHKANLDSITIISTDNNHHRTPSSTPPTMATQLPTANLDVSTLTTLIQPPSHLILPSSSEIHFASRRVVKYDLMPDI